MPFKELKGRAGEKLYTTLCDPINRIDFPWAKSHPWQSWLNRYKKNQDKFDPKISEYLEGHPYVVQQYDASQAYSKKAARKRGLDTMARLESSEDESEDGSESTNEPSWDFDEEAEVNEQLLGSDHQDPRSVLRLPKKAKRGVRKAGGSQARRTGDDDEFPDVRVGDDSAPPAWVVQQHGSSRTGEQAGSGSPHPRNTSAVQTRSRLRSRRDKESNDDGVSDDGAKHPKSRLVGGYNDITR